MANIFDRVGNESTSTGTSDFTLGSAIPGLRSFNGSVTSGSYVPYLIVMGTEWEAGIGIFTAPSTLARTRIFGSSNSNAAVNWPAGTKGVYLTMPADLLDGLFPDAKGILTMIQTAPNAAPYLAKRKIKRRSGHPITINGTTDFDGSSGDFEIGLDTASAVKTYLGAYGLDDLVDAVKGWDIPFDAGFSPVWSAQDLEVRVYREMLAGRSFTYEKLVGKLLTPSSGQPVIFDIKKEGVSIFDTKPFFAAGASTLTAGTLVTTPTTFDEEDRITFEVLQIGSGTAGAQMLVTMKNRLST
jgi:hypothetical protein